MVSKVIVILEPDTPLKEAIKTDSIAIDLELGDRTIQASPLSLQTIHALDFLQVSTQTEVTSSGNSTASLEKLLTNRLANLSSASDRQQPNQGDEILPHRDLADSQTTHRLLIHQAFNLVATRSQVAHLAPQRSYRPDSYLTDIPAAFSQEQTVSAPLAFGLPSPAPVQAASLFNPDPSPGPYQTTVLNTRFAGSINYSLRWYVSSNANPAPLIVFSHGSLADNTVFSYLGQYWSSLGYQVLFPTFNDLTTSQGTERPKQLNEILNNLAPIVAGIPQIAGRVNLQKVGVAGHSLGAYASNAVGGLEPIVNIQRYSFANPIVDAALPISPPGLGTASNTNTKNTYTLDQQSFSAIDVPYLVVTGTKDTTTGKPPDWRQDQFRYGPAPKYQVVINDANHFSYGDVAPLANQNTIKSLSHAFWDAYLLDDTSAQQWLASSDPQTWIGTTGAYSYAVS